MCHPLFGANHMVEGIQSRLLTTSSSRHWSAASAGTAPLTTSTPRRLTCRVTNNGNRPSSARSNASQWGRALRNTPTEQSRVTPEDGPVQIHTLNLYYRSRREYRPETPLTASEQRSWQCSTPPLQTRAVSEVFGALQSQFSSLEKHSRAKYGETRGFDCP